ncbi:MAG TPA: serine/threonine-protein kinase, partial [Candidatus Eisenbacteria bacterium]|nr:serine/threonine-protein kinase [Candidatus Eisenbacteria bacterium]
MDTSDSPDPPPIDAASAPGKTLLGRYRVERILGSGGMGEVLLAHDTLLHRQVALKRLRSADGSDRRKAILREARRASRISDRRIAAIYDVLDLTDDVLIVMEYVEGETLRTRMTRPIGLDAFWKLSSQCIEAVAAAHAQGVVHRDIKPENLMVKNNDEIKILDFGVAGRAEGSAPATGITSTVTDLDARTIAGTPHYMAPEAHYGGRIDERTDIFSLGVVFYELLSGHHPFGGPEATYEEVLDRVMNTVPLSLTRLNPEVSTELSDVVTRMMAKDPAQRYGSCAQVATDMERARTTEPGTQAITSPIREPSGRPRRRVARVVVAGALIVVAAMVTVAVARRWLEPPLPGSRILAVLAPVTPGASDDFSSFALGSVELLSSRLQAHQSQPGFQTVSFEEGLREKVGTSAEARQVLGANLALSSRLEQRPNVFHARLELWDTARERAIGTRTVETSKSRPFEFMNRVYAEAADVSGLRPSPASKAMVGIRGAGTLRFLLQGIGRLRRAETEAQARRALEDFELGCRTEPEAAEPRAWLALAQHKMYLLSHDASWLTKEEASAREAVGLDSNSAVAHRALATALATKRDFEGSLVQLQRTCALDPTDDDS